MFQYCELLDNTEYFLKNANYTIFGQYWYTRYVPRIQNWDVSVWDLYFFRVGMGQLSFAVVVVVVVVVVGWFACLILLYSVLFCQVLFFLLNFKMVLGFLFFFKSKFILSFSLFVDLDPLNLHYNPTKFTCLMNSNSH